MQIARCLLPGLLILLLATTGSGTGLIDDTEHFTVRCKAHAQEVGWFWHGAATALHSSRLDALNKSLSAMRVPPPAILSREPQPTEEETRYNEEVRKWNYGAWDPFSPIINCPPGRVLKRYGKDGDGGKWLCSLDALPSPCIIYSMGSHGDFSFENSMLESTKCEIHTFDCTFDGTSQGPRHMYHKWCIGSAPQPDFYTYQEVLQKLGHNSVALLKIDIEGHEFNTFSSIQAVPDGHFPAQISMEVHRQWYYMAKAIGVPVVNTLNDRSLARFAGIAAAHMLFQHMSSLGYAIVSREDNTDATPECCSEFTLMHVPCRMH